jgi:hypothetical protein
MRHAVATNLDDERCFYRGAITITPTDGGGLNFATDLNANPEAAHLFPNRTAASLFASNLTDLCSAIGSGYTRTWFVVELPEPRRT